MNSLTKVDQIVSSHFVKYDRLGYIIYNTFAGSNATEVDLYIDLYSIYHTVMSRTGRTDMSDYTSLTSSIINMCSHYRSFFKKLGVDTTIFLISSYNVPEISRKLVPGYNHTMIEKLSETVSHNMVDVNNQLIDLVSKYLYHIYFIPTSFESTIAMEHIIRLREHRNPNIIISTDSYPFGLCYRHPMTVILRPKKSNGIDISDMTTPIGYSTAVYDFYRVLYQNNRFNVQNTSSYVISPSNVDLLHALTKFPDRDLKSILSLKEGLKLIFNTIGTMDNKINLDMLLASNPDVYNKLNKSEILARYNTLNIDFQYKLFMDSVEPSLIKLEDLYDPETISKINDKYFRENPIDLLRL